MAATYYTLLTNIGQAKIANAIALGNLVQWTHMAVGDGNGNPTTPAQNQTALVREVFRAGINQLTIDADNPNYMVAEMIVPTTVGGWAVREVGIFDADGDMIAVANFPDTYKPQLEEGSGRDLVIRIIVQVSNASVVTLRVDPAVVLASQAWVLANYVKNSEVAGGTTGQVLAKRSNANKDFQWVDPSAAVSVNVNALREIQTLAAAQVVVNLAQRTTTGLAVYIEGARLLEGIDWTANSTTQLTLAQAYPAGSRIHVYQNDPFSTLADPTEVLRGLPFKASPAEVAAGIDDKKMVTPYTLAVSGVGQPSITGNATLTSTDNKIVMAGVVSGTKLEKGDVVRIVAGSYSKLHTVESLIGQNEIVVNYEHCGSRGNGPLKLQDYTGQVTITRIAKWHSAALGVGQDWVNVTSLRTVGAVYPNSTGRPIAVWQHAAKTGTVTSGLGVNGESMLNGLTDGSSNGKMMSVSAPIPAGGSYIYAGALTIAMEMR